MAARLPLVLSQPARRDATATEVIENIVAAALLMPKLDANLIGDINSIEVGGTDHLCLQGHTRDLILATFLDMPSAEAAWSRLGQHGQFIDCHSSTESIRQAAASSSLRRVFYFKLAHNSSVARLLDQFQELVAAQAVQLVSIQLGSKSSPTLGALPVVGQPPSPPVTSHSHLAHHSQRAEPMPTPNVPVPPPLDHGDEDWSSIDKLVDDLDALDI